jgi:hypothetical protein
MSFTISDRSAAQRHLNLSPAELDDNSILAGKMTALELLDSKLGTNKVGEVQALLTNLTTLETAIDTARPNEFTAGTKRVRVEGAYQIDYGTDSNFGSLQGKWDQYQKYLIELKRELGYAFDPYPLYEVGFMVV